MLCGCSHSGKPKSAECPVLVKTGSVEAYNPHGTVSFPGKVRAAEDLNLAFKVSGTLLRTPVRQGGFVRRGQLLAEIDPRDYAIQLSATEAEYKQVKAQAERVIALYDKGSVAKSDYEQAVYGLQQITAKYNAHKNALSDTRLTAPFDCYVERYNFKASETVGAGMPVVSIINSALPEVEINIPASEYIRRDEFDAYDCTVEAFENETFPLELIGVNTKANLNQLYQMRFKLMPRSGQSRPTAGMTAMVNIHSKQNSAGLTSVPVSAVFPSDDVSAVWLIDTAAMTIGLQPVKVGEILLDGRMVIDEGLQSGQEIVTAGVRSLRDGQNVRRMAKESKTNVGGLL